MLAAHSGAERCAAAVAHCHFTQQSEPQAREQGKVAALSAPHWLVSGALVLATNGGHMSAHQLTLHASFYPHAWKATCRVPNNQYRCGQFASWARLSHWWSGKAAYGGYRVVLLLEADVYVTPAGVRALDAALSTHASSQFFATCLQRESSPQSPGLARLAC